MEVPFTVCFCIFVLFCMLLIGGGVLGLELPARGGAVGDESFPVLLLGVF